MQSTSLRAAAVGCFLILIALAMIPQQAVAHEHVHVDPYEFIVGWREEPPFVGVSNGLDLGILRNVTGGGQEPVEGVADLLTATLMTGGSSVMKSLEPQFGRPGWYTFEVIPTREGSYSVRIQGTLGTTAVNFEATIQQVTARSTIEFPVTDPTAQDLQMENAALRSQTTIAMGIGLAGVVAGLVSIGLAVRAMRKRPPGP